MRAISTLVILAWLTAACGTPPAVETTTPETNGVETTIPPIPEPTESRPLEDLEAARARWEAAGLDTYSFRFLDDCGECLQLPEQTVAVWDGVVADPLGSIASIDDAFDLVEAAIAAGTDVEVVYHPELGYPTDLWIDPEARAYDGGTHLVFSAVEPGLPGDRASLAAHREARARWSAARIGSYDYDSAVVCGCEYQASMHTRVIDGAIASFDVETPNSSDVGVSPIMIDQIFADVESMLAGEVVDGYRVSGSALYDPELGYPVWIGLELEMLDPEANVLDPPLPDRLVITVSRLTPIAPETSGDNAEARDRWEAVTGGTYTFEIVFHDLEAADFADAYTVHVVDGTIESVVQNGYEFPPDHVLVPTIEELFDQISIWQQSGSQVDVIYDVERGYPSVVVALHPDGSSYSVSVSPVG